ncbi:hypothetical protein [Cyclobacterium jeungdonense]|uniref:VTC domain-containing protein n=1 Tax=Cyclobacterium jeungdonense TaxID=708087 RepID=A0ABT8CD18_9BACT|nr:hypothetical protein [Cyclobacterium jeungdonense]MDN3689581.1 hypothetical protein [Cyclobacterium jeungdonense]
MDIDHFTLKKPNYSSLEIRWFFPDNVPELQDFVLDNFNMKPEPEIRTDTYYPISNREDLGIKLRQGNHEIKKRRKPGIPFQFNGNQAGHLEYWDKWILNRPLPELPYTDPFPVRKKRWVLKFNSQSEQDYTAYPYEKNLTQGIQVEYAELKVASDTSHTFGLEVFGDTSRSHLEKITSILPDVICLDFKYSLGYPAWILSQRGK